MEPILADAQVACSGTLSSDRKLLRLGIVPYLNVQPLIWSLTHPVSDASSRIPTQIEALEPRKLAEALRNGRYDAAIVPVFEYLTNPTLYRIIPGVSIAARGSVRSVMLYSSAPLPEIRTVFLDQASLTSVHLARILLSERGMEPTYVDTSSSACHWRPAQPLAPGEAALLIGDPAMRENGRHPHSFDLGDLWRELTGLPFVFAVWLIRQDSDDSRLVRLLNEARDEGLRRIPEIAQSAGPQAGLDPRDAETYLSTNIWFGLERDDLAGLAAFADFCATQGFIAAPPPLVMA